MTSYIVIKQQCKKRIMASLHIAGELDLPRTIAQESLETGFTHATIRAMISDLEMLGYIEITNNIIRKVPPKPAPEAPE